jgi:nicotinate-nucleotide adenylyltransferase
MPAPHAPLRGAAAAASFAQRAEMLALALEGEPMFELSLIEGGRSGPSYTIDTVLELERGNPGAELFWIIGADQLARLDKWHRAGELCERITFACASREGLPIAAPPSLRHARIVGLGGRTIDISSTEIRSRIADARRIRWLLPDAVLSYIEKHALYRN